MILDVGGGAGIILREVAEYLVSAYGLRVTKMSMDLSQDALDMQAESNPDLVVALKEDICKTSLNDKERVLI